jgi:hypothetical protein
MIFLANDRYYTELTQAYNPGDTTIYLVTPPDNVPTLICVAKGTANETIFSVTNKTMNSVTGVSRLKGANVELLTQTPVTCLNNMEFINQYKTYLGMSLRGAWDSGTAYLHYDVVTNLGTTYIALQDGTNHAVTDTAYWQIMSAKGEDGAEIELQSTATYLQWRYVGGSWQNLLLLNNIKGDKGDPGGVTQTSLLEATLINDTTHTNTYSGDVSPAITSYVTGQIIFLKATNANSGAVTINVCSLGAKSVKKNVSEALATGDLKAGQILPLVYDGTNFQVVGGGGSGAGGADILTIQVFS